MIVIDILFTVIKLSNVILNMQRIKKEEPKVLLKQVYFY